MTRAEAVTVGASRYFSGKPCPKGHVAERTTSNSACVVCADIRAKAHRAANIDHVNALRRAQHAQNSEAVNAKKRAWRADNPGRENATAVIYRQNNRAKLAEKAVAYRKASPAVVAASYKKWETGNRATRYAINRNRRTRLLNAEGSHTAEDALRLCERQKWKCAACGIRCKGKHEIDHIKPLARGGSNWPSNLQMLCGTCNAKKWALDPIVFAQRGGRLL